MKRFKKNFIITIYRKAKINIYKVYYARGSVHEIALGAAIGAFWGVFPTFGLSTILTLLLYKIFRFNVLVAISAAFISNPLTSPFLLILSYKVGTFFVKSTIQFNIKTWSENLPKIGYTLFVGSTIVSSISAILMYYLVKYVVEFRRKQKGISN
jgi:hypothetical protein